MSSQMSSASKHLAKEFHEISPRILQAAKGLVFLTMIKGAFVWSGALSTGIIVKRLSPTEWSAPISVGMASFGFGLQIGGQKVDIIIVVADDEEIDVFAGSGQLKLGVQYGMTAGPIGRDMDLSAYMGPQGLTTSMYFSRSKGAYVGFSLDGALLVSRFPTNKAFYGNSVSIKQVLNGSMQPPSGPGREELARFHRLLDDFEHGRLETKILGGSEDAKAPPQAATSSTSHNTMTAEAKKEEEEYIAQFLELQESGRNLLSDSLMGGGMNAVMTMDHVVNENDPSNKAYGIISALSGDRVVILEGNLTNGLGEPLQDFVKVRVTTAGMVREGIVSKYTLQAV